VPGAVVAGAKAGGHDSFDEAAARMTGVLKESYTPDAGRAKVYDRLYRLYRRLHDIFGTPEYRDNLFDVMKELLAIRDAARGL